MWIEQAAAVLVPGALAAYGGPVDGLRGASVVVGLARPAIP
jgi:hypothetical protein